jgi:hypothetical protein
MKEETTDSLCASAAGAPVTSKVVPTTLEKALESALSCGANGQDDHRRQEMVICL